MSEEWSRPHLDERSRPQITLVQVLASALASLSGAIVASFFGLAGTIIGAAVVSVVATVAAALYTHYLHTSHAWVRQQLGAVRRSGGSRVRAPAPAAIGGRRGAHLDTVWGRLRESLGGLRWRHLTLVAVVAFALALGALTVIELGAKAPVSSLVGGDRSDGGTSIGNLMGGNTSPAPAPAPTTVPPRVTAPIPTTSSTSPSTTTTRATTTTTTAPSTSTTARSPGAGAASPQR